ncbi:MAG: FUSC family protein [Candidatus Acidiferrales bacterium]
MPKAKTWLSGAFSRETIVNSLRTALAAMISLLVARVQRLPEAYWAAITTMIVMQSTLGAALTVSGQRLIGTALGAASGALLAERFGANVYAFSAGVFVLGLICAALRVDKAAYRFAGITMAIVMLIAHEKSAWVIALHRFAEVSMGIAVALVLTAVWPGPVDTVAAKPARSRA